MAKLKKEESFWKVTYEVGNDWGEDFYNEVETFTKEEDAIDFIESVNLDYYNRIIRIEEVAEYIAE